ncbi:MAG TPA: helix-turn-helix transcriptional regulator [Candidatus Paceibacterota bacterium]
MKYRKTKNGVEYITLSDWRREQMRDPEFRKAYEALKPKYDLVRAILDARIKRGVTQSELARRVGTTQSAIARFESGVGNPTLDFISRVSTAVGARLEVRISRS